ncbi:MAG: hypothetical protein HRT40_10675 [Campylobacteraceae bacterium]|nr:hypothetical protein [Campylobacteraceae bacterium]
MKNILRIVIPALMFFSLLVYLTAPKPPVKYSSDEISLSTLEEEILLINDVIISKDELFEKGKKNFILVASHDALSIVSLLKKSNDVKYNTVLLANISSAPWFVKEWTLNDQLDKINKNSGMKMIFDSSGSFVASLHLNYLSKTQYNLFKIDENGLISKVLSSEVKMDAMKGSMSNLEIKNELAKINSYIK